GTNLNVFLGQGPAHLENGEINPLASGALLSDARVGLIRFANGSYALFAEGTVQLLGLDSITLSGHATVRVNTSGRVVDETITIPNSNQPGVEVRFSTPDRVTQFEALDVTLGVAGQTLHGNFAFDRVTGGAPSGSIRIAATHVSLGLGDGTNELISVREASGSFLFTGAGVAGGRRARP